MNTLQTLFSQPFFQALGWTLLHFIWQGALVGVLFAALSVLLRHYCANIRYAAACSALLLMLILPLATFFVISASTNGAASHSRTFTQTATSLVQSKMQASLERQDANSAAEVVPDAVLLPEDMATGNGTGDSFSSILPWLVLAWLAGASILSLRFMGGWMTAQRLKVRAVRPAPRDWEEMIVQLSIRLRLTRPVRLCQSMLVEVPTVVGWLRPVILAPAGLLAGLPAQQIEALLAHELAHIRRQDYLVNLLQTALETLLFYHPAVWWISGRVRIEREHCCDDLAVEACGDVLGYARALTKLEQLRLRSSEQFAMAATGGPLLKRVRRLLATPKAAPPRASLWLAGFVFTLVVLGIFAGATSALVSSQSRTNNPIDSRAVARPAHREVAFTFVSVPDMRSSLDDALTVEQTTRKLLETIKANGIPAVGFVGGRGLFKEGEKVPRTEPLKMWLDAGLELGNQTFSHRWLFKTPLKEFEEDVVRGEAVTRQLLGERGLPLKYFLYPYLNTGPDLETKTAFEKFLRERGYTFAPVTIDNMDWLFARVYDEARERGDIETMERVGKEYVPYMESMFEFYEKLSLDVLGYELPQVLMLSASKLNALYLEDLVQMLKRRGYSFISLDAAMKDKAYQQPDKYTGTVGISWLQRWAITKGMDFRKEPPLPPYMRQFDKRAASRSDFKTE